MIWNLCQTINEIIADGPEIETPSGEIRVIDIDTAEEWIKKLLINIRQNEYHENDYLLIKDVEKFLECLYA